MVTFYLKTEDTDDVDKLQDLFDLRQLLKKKYNIESSIVKREYL